MGTVSISIGTCVATCHLIWISIYDQGVIIIGAGATGNRVSHSGSVSINIKT